MRRILFVLVVLLLVATAWAIGGLNLPDLPLGHGERSVDLAKEDPRPEGEPNKSSENKMSDPTPAGSAQSSGPNGSDNISPSLDVARVAPEGTSVFAGQARPLETVTVLENGKAIGSVTADEHGEWILVTEHKMASADPEITLRASPKSNQQETAGATPAGQETGDAKEPSQQASPAKDLVTTFAELVESARGEAKQERGGGDEAKHERTVQAGQPDRALAQRTAPAKDSRSSERKSVHVASPEPRRGTVASRETSVAAAAKAEPAIPVPITFIYREATMTEEGRRVAGLLLEYLTIKKPNAITLTGHADERGQPDYNMDLSRERLAAIEAFLRNGGYPGKLELIAKGENEPFAGVDRSHLSRDDRYQLDRRVELVLDNGRTENTTSQ